MSLISGAERQIIFLSLQFSHIDRSVFLALAAVGLILILAVSLFIIFLRKQRKAERRVKVDDLSVMDTAEMPDGREIAYKCYGFRVEEDITYVGIIKG